MELSNIKVNKKKTGHILEGSPLYSHQFIKVLKFHEPGLAPVEDSSGAFHINVAGEAVYTERFQRTFGFYEGLAAVESLDGCFHITASGLAIYIKKYAWCGNFQEGFCPVRNKEGFFFHITTIGKPAYSEKYEYVGDFKDGIAVVCNLEGLSSHINGKGQLIHGQWFEQLDIYHKCFAQARDERGWCHIDMNGRPIYQKRFENLEPFYNGVAHCRGQSGSLYLMNESGDIIKTICEKKPNHMRKLSGEMVGFWKSEMLKLAIEFKIPDALPGTLDDIQSRIHIPKKNLMRVLRALEEVGIVSSKDNQWCLSQKGVLLAQTESSHMAAAALMWPKVQEQWKQLSHLLQKEKIQHHLSFKEQEINPETIKIYQNAIDGYAQTDFQNIGQMIDWREHEKVLALGRTAVTVLDTLLTDQKHLRGVLFNSDCLMNQFKIPQHLVGRLKQVFLNPEEKYPKVSVDAILLPRFLHYFPDEKAIQILKNIKSALSENGKLYIFEMLISKDSPSGGLLDINMLAESGGGLRTQKQWEVLLKACGFCISYIEKKLPHLHFIKGEVIA